MKLHIYITVQMMIDVTLATIFQLLIVKEKKKEEEECCGAVMLMDGWCEWWLWCDWTLL